MSPVFEAMFTSKMKEGFTQEITIIDFPDKVVEIFINFLYAHHLSDDELAKNALELWALADKYRVEALDRYLVANCPQFVNLDTVLPLVVVADKNGAESIKKKCLKLMMLHKSALVKNASTLIETLPQHILVDYFKSHSVT